MEKSNPASLSYGVDEDVPEYLVRQKKEFVEILKRGQIVAVMPVQRFPGMTSVVVIHRIHQLAGHYRT
jgi:hypothetical protein